MHIQELNTGITVQDHSSVSDSATDFTKVRVRADYHNLHGELIASAGAVGVIRSEDRGIYGVTFAQDDSGCFVPNDACGRKFHEIPSHYLEHLYESVQPQGVALTLETAVIAIAKVQAAYSCSDLEAITKMQEAAAVAKDEASLEVLCEIKSALIDL